MTKPPTEADHRAIDLARNAALAIFLQALVRRLIATPGFDPALLLAELTAAANALDCPRGSDAELDRAQVEIMKAELGDYREMVLEAMPKPAMSGHDYDA